MFKLSEAAVGWRSRKKTCVALSTPEVEYMSLANATGGSIDAALLYSFNDAHTGSTLVYEDNQCTICMMKGLQ